MRLETCESCGLPAPGQHRLLSDGVITVRVCLSCLRHACAECVEWLGGKPLVGKWQDAVRELHEERP